MNFFRSVVKSIYAPGYHREILAKSTSSAVKYFLLLMVLLSVLVSVSILIPTVSFLGGKGFASLRQELVSVYPDELVLTIDKGVASSNVAEPYLIPLPERWSGNVKNTDVGNVKNLVLINTQDSVRLSDFSTYSTAVVIGKDGVGFYDKKKEQYNIRQYSAISMNRIVIDKAMVSRYADIGASFVKRYGITFLLIFVPVILFIGFTVLQLMFLLFGALVIWLVGYEQKEKLTYGLSYKLGLHLGTLSAAYLFVAPYIPVPFGRTIVLVVVSYLMMRKASSVVPAVETPDPNRV